VALRGVLLVVLFFLLLLSGFVFAMIINGPSFVLTLGSLLFLSFIVLWPLWLYRDYKLSVEVFDGLGVVRNDERRLLWPDFVRLDEYVNLRGAMKWPPYRYELIFKDGGAVVMVAKLKNWDEVVRLVTSLPGKRREIRSRL
jgi:hypothetical protein